MLHIILKGVAVLIKFAIGGFVVFILFIAFVSTRKGKFRYERNGFINAPPEKIYPYISQLQKGAEWSPYEKIDSNLKKMFYGTDGEVGAAMDFEGNNQAGSGRLVVQKMLPNQSVEMKLIMTKPIRAENIVEYILTPEANGTRFTWAMHGDGGFFGKLINVFIDCEKLVADQFTVGINNLKQLVESQR